MTDPKRLVEDGDLGSSLLSSARGDAPSVGARRKTAAALGLAAGLAAVTTTTTAASAGTAATAGTTAAKVATTSVWLKLVAGGIVAAATVGGVATVVSRSEPPPAPNTPSTTAPISIGTPKTTTTATTVAPPAVTGAPTTTTTPQDLPEAKPVAKNEARPPTATERHERNGGPSGGSHPAATSTPAPESPLVRETRSLDAARSALQRGDAAGAIAQLDRHDREFPSGSLRTEALVLRVDALSARGDKKGAEALARQLLARDPSGPHAKHLRRIAGEPDP